MGAGVGLGHGHPGVDLHGAVVVDVPVGVEHAAVPVVGELVQADVAHDDQVIADFGADVADGLVEDAVRIQRGGALGVADRRECQRA